MPEGPEIRLAADEVGKALVGKTTIEVDFSQPHLHHFGPQLSGHQVTEVSTRGKAILTHFDNHQVVFSHNQLYGRWFITPAGQFPKTKRQLRLAIHNQDYSALLYSASDIEVLQASELSQHPFLARLGPDLLSEKPKAKIIEARLKLKRFRNRQLATVMLDQGFVAGLGNYLRAEILTHAGLHPERRPSQCSDLQLQRLAQLIVSLSRRAYLKGGIVNSAELVSQLKKQGLTQREQHRFNTYGRAGLACHFCKNTIEVSNAGGRKMYFCPHCQSVEKSPSSAE